VDLRHDPQPVTLTAAIGADEKESQVMRPSSTADALALLTSAVHDDEVLVRCTARLAQDLDRLRDMERRAKKCAVGAGYRTGESVAAYILHGE